jgi:deazaflavin-dependent oxidoreductase (nitroreductase family)
LFGVPIDGDVAILGTHFGHRNTPAWVYNIEADQEVEVEYREVSLSARARRASPDEEKRIWDAAASTYPGYALYTERASHREIRVFVLEPR